MSVTRIAGSIKFFSETPRDQIIEFMQELKAGKLGTWIDLHMRDSGGETYLCFRYDLGSVQEKIHRDFQHQIIGRLKRRFGEDEDGRPEGVRGWSISNVLASAI